ncbi:cytochrome P450 [methanotrophic endosymbiont of Bathymodiolus puteoserpentis (Logatchev)]|jgi:cytochrome P450|uniref:cytochrome P450 n=1 Tax=methanotrophic endosymbiont of Bathymodiolus puteoserpentis (Logatchev) TaxID=343235 RepID=UPI0013CD0BC8|nr:cytochrome P450 [methanotrophic endosymbiont of Bathymodiolus puteoserpentis (Logatchev)]SHE20183.1 cytochrome P450 [methanotrophic endosymbiont of Bathymodiolus puteoserpentis (Logatchev)]
MPDSKPLSLPPGEDIIINYHQLEQVLPQLTGLVATEGNVFKAKFPDQNSWVYNVCDPDMAKHILVTNYKNYKKGVGIKQINVLLGRGIIVSEGELWKRQRKMMQPLFSHKLLTQQLSLMTHCADKLIASWDNDIKAGKPINLTESMSQTALDFILHALFSEDLERIIVETGENPFLMVTDDSARDLLFARRFRQLTHLVSDMMQRRRAENRQPFDLLTMVMNATEKRSGEAMPEKLQIDEILTMIIAGHETTASVLNWTWYLLTQHTDIEQQVLAESQQYMPLDSEPSMADIGQLKFTEQVLDESMRLYPPVWVLTRQALADDHYNGFDIPAGTDILIPPYLMHRNVAYWPDPEVFDPQRFSPENKAKHHIGAYLPFAIGPRRCIGDSMAIQEMAVHISRIIQKIHFELVPGQAVELEPLVNLRPKQDIFLHATYR